MVFLLRYYEEKPHAEIASMLGITEGAVKANYHQAIKKLRTALSGYIKG
jgi:RNA polymerase sigma-70 factor (ECF subfamily)